MSRSHLFRDARVIDPETGLDSRQDVLVKGRKIAAVGETIDAPDGAIVTECRGNILSPGIVDMRVFIGEPGGEHRETIRSAGRAAAAGGVTTMVMMPDTDPVIDDVALVEFVRSTAARKCAVKVKPVAALTKDMQGEQLTEFGLLKKAGAVAFSAGVESNASAQMMRRALTYAKDFGALVIAAACDPSMGGGVMASGETATRLGLSGVPAEAEAIALDRDMRLVGMTGSRYHAATLSSSESTHIVRRAKSAGQDVTAGVAIANLSLADQDVGAYRTYLRVTPPLRSVDDRMALIEAVRDGTIDIICSNHMPQDVEAKRQPFAEAASGAVGLETLLAAALRLHFTNDIPLIDILKCLTINPAKRLGLKTGRIAVGAPADMMLFDPDAPWVCREEELRSRARNTPFEGERFQGLVLKTMVSGRIVFERS
ncbi:MAG: dihydroorotase [Pseudomonadota bacterium]